MSKGIKLANGLTAKDEQYAQLLAQGMSQADAYRQLWPREDRPDDVTYSVASQKALKVRDRVNEIVQAAAQETAIDLARLTEMTLEDRRDARAVGQFAVAMQGNKLLADMYNLRGQQLSADKLLNGIVNLLQALDPADRARTIDASEVE